MLKSESGSTRAVLFVLFLLALVASTSSSIRGLITFASDWDNTNASQPLIIPLISAGLIYHRRKVIFERARYDLLPGVLIMIAGTALHVFGRTKNPTWQEGDHLAL